MRRYGLIGRPLGHSASAAYFAAKFEREGIADCAYALYELPDIGALEGLLARTPDLCGFNVTIPYKREVMPLLDALSHDARMIGAVNCVRRAADGSLTGHNTDVVGLRAERLEFLFLDGHGRRHDEDAAAGMPLDRGLERRLRADDGHVRKFGAQCIGRGGGRGVTGDDDGLCAFVQQMLHDRAAARRHLVHGFHTVGRVE